MIETLFALIPVVGIVLTAFAILGRLRLHSSRVLREAAGVLGLESVEASFGFPRVATGSVGHAYVWITPVAVFDSAPQNEGEFLPAPSSPAYRVVVKRPGRIPDDLTITSIASHRGFFGSLERITVGDRGFDDSVAVQGPLPVVLALLDHSTRLSLTTLVKDSLGRVKGGSIQLDSGPHGDGASLAQAVRFVLSVATALSRSGTLPERLAANSTRDAIHGVRLLNLQVLCSTYPRSEEARVAAQRALSDKSPYLRLEGASFLGKEGVETLRQLVAGEPMPAEVVAGALAALSRLLPEAEVAPLLLEAAKWRKGSPRIAAIEGLGHLRHAPAMGALAVLLDEGDAEVAGAAARALGEMDGTEGLLLRSLRSRQTAALLAVVDVLGQKSSVGSVPDLSELARDGNTPSPLRQAARDAVRRIQARAPGAGAGQLAMAEASGPEGSLTLADDEDPKGQVALTEGSEP